MLVAKCFNFFFEGLGLELVLSLSRGGLFLAGLLRGVVGRTYFG